MRVAPHDGAVANRRMRARRASRLSAPLPTMSRTRDAARLFERRIIGDSSAWSPARSWRPRTLERLR